MAIKKMLIDETSGKFKMLYTLQLIAVWDTHKTGPLVYDQADDACCEEERDYDDNDQMHGMRKQAASGPQGADDRSTSTDPRHHRDRNENEGDELTGDANPEHVNLFRVRAVEQTFHRRPTKGIQQREYYDGQDKDSTDHQGQPGVCEESVSLCGNGIRHVMFHCLPASHDRQQDQADGEQVEPHDEKQHGGETFIEISPVDNFHDHEWKDEEKAGKRRWSNGLLYGLHNIS